MNQFSFDPTNETWYSIHAPDGSGAVDQVIPNGIETSFNVYLIGFIFLF